MFSRSQIEKAFMTLVLASAAAAAGAYVDVQFLKKDMAIVQSDAKENKRLICLLALDRIKDGESKLTAQKICARKD